MPTALTIVDPGSNPAAPPADARREYVSGQPWAWYGAMVRGVPSYRDPLEIDFGPRIFDEMMLDAQVQGSVNIRRMAALSKPWSLAPDESLPADRLELGTTIADFCRMVLTGLGRKFTVALFELLGALIYAQALAEMVWDYATFGPAGPQLVITDVKIKPRENVIVVIDLFGNELGVIAVQPGQAMPWLGALTFTRGDDGVFHLDSNPDIELLPRTKFVLHKHQPGAGRALLGRSILPPVWPHWWAKRQLDPEYQKYLVQFATPSAWGTPGEKAQPHTERDPRTGQPIPGGRTIYPEEEMLAVMEGIHNGSARVYPYGAAEHPVEMQGDGSPYLKAYDYRDRNIVLTVLFQELATKEGQHQTRAATKSHQDVLATVITGDKQALCDTIRTDLLTPLVRANYGDAAVAAGLVPVLSLGEVEQQDLSDLINAVAALWAAGGIHRSQKAGLDDLLDLPPTNLDEWNADYAATQALAARQAEAATARAAQPSPSPAGAPAAQGASA